jgi:hypothetical protein
VRTATAVLSAGNLLHDRRPAALIGFIDFDQFLIVLDLDRALLAVLGERLSPTCEAPERLGVLRLDALTDVLRDARLDSAVRSYPTVAAESDLNTN